ncbi:SH3 domain-containing protein [Aquisalinus flavus]|uniref:SH3b domain-containing protein n=1 Tax=Aquisalinus flavus TaxID=1526572 RepID=A0A8J2V7U2_9PROT|nr:SH3 domain-containing protein [Aquisalinus flavus]MBD0425359.1 hypothetical protein [Aquisalinus flavus]UNE48991.1 hypothetical protein FF099_13505 [Aquisalinus flavus]GGD16729.1 hypothetical protein GCM10011342_26840 [Aquisalinus flavus]
MMTMPARVLFSILLLSLMAALPVADAAAQVGASANAPKMGYSGLPVPRFVNLKSDETNARVGPSMDYPVRFVFSRRGLPVRVVAETPDNVWRKVEDFEGETMWIHQSQLVSSGVVLVTEGTALMHARPAEGSEVRAALERGVLADTEKCDDGWCLVRVDGYRGWVAKSSLWGVD